MRFSRTTQSGNYGQTHDYVQQDFQGYLGKGACLGCPSAGLGCPGGCAKQAMGNIFSDLENILGKVGGDALKGATQSAKDAAIAELMANPEVQESLKRSAFQAAVDDMAKRLTTGYQSATSYWAKNKTKMLIMGGLGVAGISGLTYLVLSRRK